MRTKLPLIPLHWRWFVFGVGYLVFCFFYLVAQQAPWASPVLITPSTLDQRIPFLGWSILIYFSQFLLIVLPVWKIREERTLSSTFYSMAVASCVSFLLFFLFPTRLPRTFTHGDSIEGILYTFLYAMDSDSNCFPSLHVSLAFLSSLGLYRYASSRFAFLVFLWPTLIGLSTLTTKQHYFVDVIGGLVVGVLSLFFVELLLQRNPH